MIEINNLTKKFGKVVAVDNMTVNIKDGSVIGLVGSNGSGKSTLLRMLAGVYAPDGGTVRIDGIELLEFNLPKIKIRVTCGKGTYIRSLARDIGEALNSGAYLTALERTRIGEYRLETCINPEAFPEWLEKHSTPCQ